MNKKEFHTIDKRIVRHRENLRVRINPDEAPDKDVSMGRVCRRGYRSGIIKK